MKIIQREDIYAGRFFRYSFCSDYICRCVSKNIDELSCMVALYDENLKFKCFKNYSLDNGQLMEISKEELDEIKAGAL